MYQDSVLRDLMKVGDPYSREAGSIVARMQGANDFVADILGKIEYSQDILGEEARIKQENTENQGDQLG